LLAREGEGTQTPLPCAQPPPTCAWGKGTLFKFRRGKGRGGENKPDYCSTVFRPTLREMAESYPSIEGKKKRKRFLSPNKETTSFGVTESTKGRASGLQALGGRGHAFWESAGAAPFLETPKKKMAPDHRTRKKGEKGKKSGWGMSICGGKAHGCRRRGKRGPGPRFPQNREGKKKGQRTARGRAVIMEKLEKRNGPGAFKVCRWKRETRTPFCHPDKGGPTLNEKERREHRNQLVDTTNWSRKGGKGTGALFQLRSRMSRTTNGGREGRAERQLRRLLKKRKRGEEPIVEADPQAPPPLVLGGGGGRNDNVRTGPRGERELRAAAG